MGGGRYWQIKFRSNQCDFVQDPTHNPRHQISLSPTKAGLQDPLGYILGYIQSNITTAKLILFFKNRFLVKSVMCLLGGGWLGLKPWQWDLPSQDSGLTVRPQVWRLDWAELAARIKTIRMCCHRQQILEGMAHYWGFLKLLWRASGLVLFLFFGLKKQCLLCIFGVLGNYLYLVVSMVTEYIHILCQEKSLQKKLKVVME